LFEEHLLAIVHHERETAGAAADKAKTKRGVIGAAAGALIGATCPPQESGDPFSSGAWATVANAFVEELLEPQTSNGHLLEWTIWDHMFERGTSCLTPDGRDHLAYLARLRSLPANPRIYLQTACDIPYDVTCPDQYAEDRAKLDSRRQRAILNFLSSAAKVPETPFEVIIIDPH
jgi:hypothetical protein